MLRLAAALAAGALLIAAPAAAHEQSSQPQLRQVEESVLGPEHAAEHARARAAARRQARAARRCKTARRHLRRLRRAGAARPALKRQRRRAHRACHTRAAKEARAAGILDVLFPPPPPPPSPDPAISGRWDPPVPIPLPAVHAALLPTGKVLWFTWVGAQPNVHGRAWLFDPATGASRQVDPPLVYHAASHSMRPANIWCAAQSHLPDGSVLVVGGTESYANNENTTELVGSNRLFVFDPWTETWTAQPKMRKGRWYPSSARLPDGRTALVSGLDNAVARGLNPDLELFTAPATRGGQGSVSLLAEFDKPGTPQTPNMYPHMAVLASGRTLINGPGVGDTWFLHEPGQPAAFSWSQAPNLSRTRVYSAAVPLPGPAAGPARVLQLGGFPAFPSSATNTSELFNEAQPAAWQSASPMAIARAHENAVLLPDGSMVAVGGGTGAVNNNLHAATSAHRAVELWNPATETWRLGASQQEFRAYHSTALLLPDGRVLSAGDDFNGGSSTDTAEIYHPPYLFKGQRPSITSAPSSIAWGQPFKVTAAGGTIARATLIAPSAVTHANDMGQRALTLSTTTRADGSIDVEAPASPAAAPPGYYMLFLVNDAGVPSVARWVQLR